MNIQRRFGLILSTVGFAGMCALAAPLHAQDSGTAPAAPAATEPEEDLTIGKGNLVFQSTTEETGVIFDSDTPTLEFKFRNTGVGSVTIKEVKPACGCTAVALEQTTYAPGETGVLQVVFDPKNKQGAIARNIQVFTDQDNNPNQTLIVRSYVKPILVIQPYQIAFAPVEKGSSSTRDIHVKGRFEGFEVTRATTQDSTVFSLEIIDNGTVVEDGDTLYDYIVRVTVAEDAKPENYRTEVSIRTNDETKPIFSVPAVVRVMGDLQMTPIRMTLGRLAVGDNFAQEIHVRSKSGKSFEITSVNSNTVALDADYTFEPVDPEVRNDWIVRATGKVVNVAPRFNAQLFIATDVEDEDLVSVQMYGQLRRN